MEKLHELDGEWERDGRALRVTSLEQHEGVSEHPLAVRRRKAAAWDERNDCGNTQAGIAVRAMRELLPRHVL